VGVPEGEAHEVKTHTLAQLRRQLAETVALLPSIRLYQIHSATLTSGVLDNAEVLDALAALRDGTLVPGLPRVVPGLSVSHPQPPAIEAATNLSRGGAPLFGEVQATFNLLDQSAGPALAAAHHDTRVPHRRQPRLLERGNGVRLRLSAVAPAEALVPSDGPERRKR